VALADYIGKYWAGAEVMYGIIIAMTFTSVLRDYPVVFDFILNRVIFSALMCCIAWGIADGLFYVWERSYLIRQENTIIQSSKSPQQNAPALSLIADQLDDTILRNISQENRQKLYQSLVQYLSTVDIREKVSARDTITILLGTFVRSAAAGFVIVLPFFVVPDVANALILSNTVGILLLFCVGYVRALERDFLSKVINGIAASFIGIIIAAITILLGG
jgi:hypothetical protein